jgi:phosphoglycerate kinase
MSSLKCINDIDISGKKVLIRCDFNVPIDNGKISDDRRISSSLKTIKYALDKKCSVILMSHFGRPTKGGFEKEFSLQIVADKLKELLGQNIIMAKDIVNNDTKNLAKNLKSGEVMLLENIRFETDETKNSEELGKTLASLADVFINDAFGVSHRKHSSVYAVAQNFDTSHKAAGYLLWTEMDFFNNTIASPKRPFVAIVGGSKVSSKLATFNHLLKTADKMIVGGGMAFTFLKAQGYNIGNSLVEDDLLDEAKKILDNAKKHNVEFLLPLDCVVAKEFKADANAKTVDIDSISSDEMGLDIGEKSSKLFHDALNDAKTILWNGPMGVYEMEKFANGSNSMCKYIANLDTISVIGGGDTADLIKRRDLEDEMTFISTGGGASLSLLEGNVLPGVQALSN